jgi:hypothetical protein
MHPQSLIPFALVATLQVADAYLTWRLLTNGGRELNPIVRILMERLGIVAGLALTKLALLAVTALWLADHFVLMLLLAGLYTWVVRHNWKQLAGASARRRES